MLTGPMGGLQRRDVGTLPVSVGTSLAIEGLRQPHLPHYDHLWINLRTLYRNIQQAVDIPTRDSMTPDMVREVMIDEMNHITEAMLIITGGRITPQWYVSEPNTLVRILPEAIIRSPQTDLQKMVYTLSEAAIEPIVKMLKDKALVFRPLLHGSGNTLLLTHYPTDLLGRRNFANLMLLESHTGKIKQHAEFSSKLTNGSELNWLPFNGFTLSVFGDNNVLLRQMPQKMRNLVLEIAKKYKWTPMTTRAKMTMDLGFIRDELGKQYLRKVLSKTTY